MNKKKDEKRDSSTMPQQDLHGSGDGAEEESLPEGETVTVPEQDFLHLQRQVADYKDKYVRLLAEFENARKRQERERLEFIKYANEGVMVDFLNIVDDLERTVGVAQEKHQDYDAFLKGVEMVMKHVKEFLKKHGVEVIDPAGKPFDPYAHEILVQEPSTEHADATVIEALQKGYKIGDKVIRTAKVKVAVNRKTEDQDTAQ